MDPTLKFTLLLMLSGLVMNIASTKADFLDCERTVKDWEVSSLDNEISEDNHTLKDLLFFLHVPRTGGRTFFHCLLKKLYSSSLECPRSYDKLRFDPSKAKCRLLTTHDDYSMMSKLNKERTSVVTIVRNPVDRVFSTYEFSMEVAARFLVQPNLTAAKQFAGRMRSKVKGTSTLDIWPWKYLVPWMRDDIFARRDARKVRGIVDIKSSDPYNMEDVVMPLEEYINYPIADDIIHNGATFQIAGLTNNSLLADSHKVRHCVQKYKVLGDYVLRVAKKRLDNMLYVGLTEDHRKSATIFANVVGPQVISQLAASNANNGVANLKSEQSSSIADSDVDNYEHQNSTSDKTVAKNAPAKSTTRNKDSMTVGRLTEGWYDGCISNLRGTHTKRQVASLKRISPANFTKEARLKVPEAVLQKIRALNSLDLELYEYARQIFAKQEKVSAEKLLTTEALDDNMFGYSTIINLRTLALLAPPVLLIFIFVIVNARRKAFKVKV